MDEQEFNNAIENNKGWYLFNYCYDNLTEEQKQICKQKTNI